MSADTTVAEWVAACVAFDAGSHALTTEAYNDYLRWCNEEKRYGLSRRPWLRELAQLAGGTLQSVKRNGVMQIPGMRLTQQAGAITPAQDASIGQWLRERAATTPGARMPARELYRDYHRWAHGCWRAAVPMARWLAVLHIEHGATTSRDRYGGVRVHGITIPAAPMPEPEPEARTLENGWYGLPSE